MKKMVLKNTNKKYGYKYLPKNLKKIQKRKNTEE